MDSSNQQVPDGYKMTEIGVIPEDWCIVTLNSITSEIGDGIHTTPIYSDNGEYFFINGNNLREGHIILFDNTKTVNYSEFKKHEKKLGERTILLSINGTIGNIGLYDNELILLGKSAAYLNIDSSINKLYVYHFLQTTVVTRQFNDSLTGSTIKNLSLAGIRYTEIAAPPTTDEQQAIATVLSETDAFIESLEQLIVKKRKIKDGTLRELLRPKQEWIRTQLGTIGIFLKGRGVSRDESLSGNLPCVRYGEIYTKHNNVIYHYYSYISEQVSKTAIPLKCGDLLFAGSGETKEDIGKCVAFIDDIEAYAGGDIVILRPEKAHSEFMGYYMNSKPIVQQKASKGQGDAVVHITATSLADIEISIPPLEEQAAIASILSDMHAEITTLEEKLAKTRQIKQGMMHNLLTGKIRIL